MNGGAMSRELRLEKSYLLGVDYDLIVDGCNYPLGLMKILNICAS